MAACVGCSSEQTAVADDALARGSGWVARLEPDALVVDHAGSALRVAPARLARGGVTLSSAPRSEAAAVRDLGVAIERIEPRARGVEVTWTLAAPPAGTGDLEITMPFAGMRAEREDHEGIHLRGASEHGVLVSRAVLVDANGVRTPLETFAEADALHVVVSERALRERAYPLVVDPIVSPEIALSPATDDPLSGFGRTVTSPRVARNPSGQSLAVWADNRLGAGLDIWGAILGDDGSVVRKNLLLVSASGDQDSPDVAWDGTQWVVAYCDRSGTSYDIRAIRVSSAGAVVGAPIGVATGTANEDVPRITAHESGAAVVWNDYRAGAGGDVYAARIATDGTLMDPGGVAIATGATAQLYPVIRRRATGSYLAVWYVGGDLHASRLSGALTPGPEIALIADAGIQQVPAVATDGSGWMVTYEDRSTTPVSIRAIYVGTSTIGTSFQVAPSLPGTVRGNADVEYDGTNFVAVGPAGTIWQAQKMSSTAIVGGAFQLGPSSPSVVSGIDVVRTSSGNWLAATGYRTQNLGGNAIRDYLFAYLFGPTGATVSGPSAMATAAKEQEKPRVAYGSDVWLAAWIETFPRYTAYAATVRRDGTTTAPVMLGPASEVALCHDGTYFVAVWNEPPTSFTNQLSGALVDPASGAVGGVSTFDTTGDSFYTTSSPGGLTIACAGTDVGVAFLQQRTPMCSFPPCSTGSTDVLGLSLSTTGGLLSSRSFGPFPVASSSADETNAILTESGGGFLLAYRSGTSIFMEARTSTMAGGGFWSAGTGVPIALASHGTTYALVTANELRMGAIGAAPSSTTSVAARAIAWDGSAFLTAIPSASSDVEGQRFGADGSAVDAVPFDIAATSMAESQPALASDGEGIVLAGYQVFDTTIGITAARARARFVDDGRALGTSCSDGTTCGSGYCVDGVCCDSPCGGGADDCQACAVAAGALTDGTCGPRTAGTTCRAASGACDAAEVCDGVATSCPADVLATSTVVCRPASDACDAPETCTGSDAACPADALVAAGTDCRAAAGACDVAEQCDGSSAACPADLLVAPGTTCRASMGACDLEEACTGTSALCPLDLVASAGTTCRASMGACDVAELCDGAGVACPADVLASAGATCRASMGACDVDEVCDGAGVACPADVLASAGTTCRASMGACDLDEVCTGSDAACPADVLASAGATCRASMGACDVDEVCTGSDPACPADVLASAGTTCRASMGACDVDEVCTGSDAACPADVLAASSVECRPATSACDVAETCSGVAAECPSDALASSGTSCDDGDACTSGDACDGEGACTGIAACDAGVSEDGGASDDAGTIDRDAAIRDDGGPDAGVGAPASGCGCRAAGEPGGRSWIFGLAIALALARARRRR